MKITIFLFFLMLTPVLAQDDLRARQTAACQGDAINLCGPVLDDETKIASCLLAQKARLSPACQAMFSTPHKRHHK